MRPSFRTVHDFCLHVLESGDLATKLLPPRAADGGPLPDSPAPAVFLDRPARSDQIRIRPCTDRLPRLAELRDPHARALCVERFANHELMAVELFAWALLAFPEMPAPLRRGLLHVLEEEQGHVRLYVDRLERLGSGLGQNPLSDYFWQQVPGIRASDNGPAAFLCVMGLTFEQANLDFSLLYRDAFRLRGDEESAEAMDRVHHDEISHVRLAARWLRRIGDRGGSAGGARAGAHVDAIDAPSARAAGPRSDRATDARDRDLYLRYVPFPLSAARAKGRRFDVAARRRAGLSEAFIECVREARPYERRPASIESPLASIESSPAPIESPPAPIQSPATSIESPATSIESSPALRVLHANFGAEERRDAKRATGSLLRLLSLWHGLFPTGTSVELPARTFPPGTPWSPLSPRAIFAGDLARRLAGWEGLIAWYGDVDAARAAARAGLPLAGPEPTVVARVHDKAFAARVARVQTPSEFASKVLVLDAELLARAPTDAAREIAAWIEAWPAAWRAGFVLKPRFGTSGRGRVAGRGLPLDETFLRALPRLAERGGAVLEPWVRRVDDLSAQFWVEADARSGSRPAPSAAERPEAPVESLDGAVRCLGTTCQILGPNGVYYGNRGVYRRERNGSLWIGSGHAEDERFRHEAALLVAGAAGEGFRGPCGVDGFTYFEPGASPGAAPLLRSLVELNARFTTGTVALGWLERVLSNEGVVGEGEWCFVLAPKSTARGEGPPPMPPGAVGPVALTPSDLQRDGWRIIPLSGDEAPPFLALR